MKELGLYLKKERENQKLSLEDVADRTKIHIEKLRAIEAGDRDALPAKVFCIGLIKSYSRELKVDTEVINDFCQKAFEDIPKDPETPQINNTINDDEEDSTQTVGLFQVPRLMTYVGSGLVILVLLFGISSVVKKLNSYSKEKPTPENVYNPVESDLQSELNSEINSIDTQILSDESNEITDNKVVEAKVEEPKKKVEEVKAKKPKQDEPKKVVAIESKQETPTVEVTEEPEEVVDTTPTVVEESDEVDDSGFDSSDESTASKNTVVSDNKLVISAIEPIRAEVIWSDGYVQVMLLKSQETKTLVFSTPITIKVNNGGAVQVSFNDSEKKVPGNFNQPIELKYP